MNNATVTVVSTTTTTDSHGDSTTATAEATLAWALVAPRTSAERVDPHAPAVITSATLYAPYDTAIDSDDTVRIADHSAAMDGIWQAEGMPGPWGMDGWKPGLEVALTRVSGPPESESSSSSSSSSSS